MKALIIDDERLARKELINLLKEYAEIDIIGEAENVEQAKQKIDALQPDVLFLDVEMPEKTGFELINEIDTNAQIVFVTAYQDHAIAAFDISFELATNFAAPAVSMKFFGFIFNSLIFFLHWLKACMWL